MQLEEHEIEGIGKVTFRASHKARHIRISLKPNSGIRVTVPRGASLREARTFLLSKKTWVQEHLKKIKALERSSTLFSEDSPYRTRHHELWLQKHQSNILKSNIKGGLIHVYYPENMDVTQPEVQTFIKKSIEEALRKEARVLLPKRVGELAALHGFKHQTISIKNAKTRWGSCSFRDNINLSLHLMRLPDHLIDYVILHELCHTVEKNHSHRFWKLLDQVCGNARGLDKELKKYRIGIF